LRIKFDNNREYRFADASKMVADGEGAVPKGELDEKDAGGLLGDKK
jgi:hypothetical protein